MSFAREKLYKEYLRHKMPIILTTVKVREIVPHLPCLTDYDRETIEAKRETCGNYNGMMLLLDCLKRRENWPEQFIEALEACDYPTIAAGIRKEYDALRGINNSDPSSPLNTVIRASVHPAPCASHVCNPESDANSQAAVAPPAESAPPEPAGASSPPETTGASHPPETAGASSPPETTGASSPPETTGASSPPGTAGASSPPETAEASSPPETAGASPPPETAGASSPPETTGASPPPETAGASPPPETAGASSPPETTGASPPPETAGASPPPETAEASPPPEPAAQASTPPEIHLQPQAPQNSAAPVTGSLYLPEPVAEPPQPAPIEVRPTPSPLSPNNQATATTPLPQRDTRTYQEPEENSESFIQNICGDNGGLANQVAAPIQEAKQSEPESPPSPDLLRSTTTTEVKSPQSPPPAQKNSDDSDDSSLLVMTPEKPPIQETIPPVDINPAAIQQPAETPVPFATQVVESNPQTQTTDPVFPVPDNAWMNASLLDGKPGQLISVQAQNHGSPTLPAPSSPVMPYSGNSERLEISSAAVTSTRVPTCSSASTSIGNTVSALPCQENGVAVNQNEPEENQYVSLCQSLEFQDVRVNVVQISEEPSILNLDGKSSTPQAQIVNGEAAREAVSAPPLPTNAAADVTSENTASGDNYNPSEPLPAAPSPQLNTPQDSEEAPPPFLPSNTKYILTAAGFGACALLMAWKFKN